MPYLLGSYIVPLSTVGRKNVTREIFSWRRIDRTGLLAAELPLAHARVCVSVGAAP